MATSTYPDPKALLLPYLEDLQLFEQLKYPGQEEPLDCFESLELLGGPAHPRP
ncbi:MAG: hypothetical protein ACYCX0_11245 [Desulfurivibrionaceae bacterium]|jgi:hypothetical protein